MENFKNISDFFALFWGNDIWKSIAFKTNEKAADIIDQNLENSSNEEEFQDEMEEEEGNKDEMEEDEQDEIDEDNLSKCEDHISNEEESLESDEFIRNEKAEPKPTNWTPVDVAKIKTFFSICIIMGLAQMDNIYDYWKKEFSNFGIYGNLFISSRMSRNRFMEIRRFIRFNLDEIRKETIQKFQAHWILFSEITVDETLLLFKGRFRFKQHIRRKPGSTGTKVYAMNDKTGFFYDYWFYQGKNGKTIDIVSNFVSKLEKIYQNYTVYTDSYYGNLELAEYLNERYFSFILSCGKNRPSFLFSNCLHEDLEKGNCSSTVNPSESMFALSFKDKKIFNVISNFSDPLQTTISRKEKQISEVINDYNFNMHGVDKGDRYVNIYIPAFSNRS